MGNEIQTLAPEYEDSCTFFFTDREELDITDREAVFNFVETNGIDIIINCAAYTAVDKAETDEALADLLNHVAPGYLAEAVESVGGTMIQVSTDYVFDGKACQPYEEDSPTNPQTVYGRTKLLGEESVIRSCAGSMVVRTAWLYSTFGNNFVKTMMRLGKERDSLGVVFDQVGSPTYARDLAAVILKAADQGVVPGVYHYTNEGVCSWYDFAKMICKLSGNTCDISPCYSKEFPSPVKRPHFSVLDKRKIKETFGIKVPYWTDSLEVCIKQLAEANNK